jgi:hypothetical protein
MHPTCTFSALSIEQRDGFLELNDLTRAETHGIENGSSTAFVSACGQPFLANNSVISIKPP